MGFINLPPARTYSRTFHLFNHCHALCFNKRTSLHLIEIHTVGNVPCIPVDPVVSFRHILRHKFGHFFSENVINCERYKGWKALRKLEYVDELMSTLAGKPPLHQPKFRAGEYECLDVKLRSYYEQKRNLYEESYPDFYDKDLRRIFTGNPGETGCAKASRSLKTHRRQILNSVCIWTNEKKYTVNQLLMSLIARCDELNLHVKRGDSTFPLHVTSYITTLVMNYLFTGKFKRSI